MLAVLYDTITPNHTSPQSPDASVRASSRRRVSIASNASQQRSQSTAPGLYSYMSGSKVAIERLLFGYHAKTKRTLAEEAESGDETSVFSWIRDGVDVDEADTYGYTPLLNAATLGRINTVAELIKNGADVNKRGQFGYTALHAAAQVRHSSFF
jgi:ankyrin repeat protein